MALRYLGYVAALMVAGVLALAAFGFTSLEFAATELVVIAALLTLDRTSIGLSPAAAVSWSCPVVCSQAT
jgi:hypothetical protein